MSELCTTQDLWTLTNTLLVYGLGIGIGLTMIGSQRSKNSVSIITQTFLLLFVVILVWLPPFSYWSIKTHGFWSLMSTHSSCAALSKSLFQSSFLYVAVMSFLGASLERAHSLKLLVLCALWALFVYLPVAYLVWNPQGFIYQMGIRDFAGGLVVHLSSGFSALALSQALGRRIDYFNLRRPSSITMIFSGNLLILLGWLSFNSGSHIQFDYFSLQVLAKTLIAGLLGVLTWTILELLHPPHRLHFIHTSFGLVSALVATTPHIDKLSAIATLGLVVLAVIISFYSTRLTNKILKIDDPMEVFSSHGVSSIIGGLGAAFLVEGLSVHTELAALLIVASYSYFLTLILSKLFIASWGLRLSSEREAQGLDIYIHGEKVASND